MSFSRRSLLKGVLATQAFGVAHKLAFGAEHASTSPTSIQQLNVIVHGLAAIVVPPGPSGGVTIFLPDSNNIMLNHVQRAGSFPGGQNDPKAFKMKPGHQYSITNLKNSNTTFPAIDNTMNAVISGSTVDISGLNLFMSIALPFPDSFFSLRQRARKDGVPIFSGADSKLLLADPKTLATVHIFQFSASADPHFIDLNGPSDIPITENSQAPGTANWHFYNEPPDDIDPDQDFCHALLAFRQFREIKLASGIHKKMVIDFNVFDTFDDKGMVGSDIPISLTGVGKDELLELPERTPGGQGANCVKLLITP